MISETVYKSALVIFFTLFVIFLSLYLHERQKEVVEENEVEAEDRAFVQHIKPLKEDEIVEWKDQAEVMSPTSVPASLGLEECAGQRDYVCSKVYYQDPNKRPMVSIVTVRPCDPDQSAFDKCVLHLEDMVNPSFEHVVIQPQPGTCDRTTPYPFRQELKGRYIYMLEEEDHITNALFVSRINAIFNTMNPKMIVFHSYSMATRSFLPTNWRTFPGNGDIHLNNVVIREDVFKVEKNLGCLHLDEGGVDAFLQNCFLDCEPEEIIWMDDSFVVHGTPRYREVSVQNVVTPDLKLTDGIGEKLFKVATAFAYSQLYDKTLMVKDPLFRWNKEMDVIFNAYEPTDRLANVHGNVCLLGSLSEYENFEAYRRLLIKNLWSEEMEEMPYASSRMRPTVSMHVCQSHPVTYYVDAVKTIQHHLHTQKLTIVVFSDDLTWCKEQFKREMRDIRLDIQYVERFDRVTELRWMSTCNHHVLSDSNYSWWGAYLDDSSGSIVVAPKEWTHATPLPGWRRN